MTAQSFTQLLDNKASGSSDSVQWYGGTGQLAVDGTWGHNSLKVNLEVSPDDGTTWIAVGGDASFSEAGIISFTLGSCDIRITLDNPHASTSIDAWITKTSGQWT